MAVIKISVTREFTVPEGTEVLYAATGNVCGLRTPSGALVKPQLEMLLRDPDTFSFKPGYYEALAEIGVEADLVFSCEAETTEGNTGAINGVDLESD